MNTADDVKAFTSQKTLALVGVSRNKDAFSSKVFHDLKAKGFKVIPVNPLAEKIGADVCYPSLGKIPEKAGAVLVFTPPQETEKIVKEAHAARIEHIWIQQGAESDAALAFCKEKGLKAVSGQCIQMFAEPVKSYHAFHRWIWKVFGKIPK